YSIVVQFGLVPRSNFLWMAETMLELASKYQDKIQLAFKPHPRLLTELYKHPDWGKEKTDAYYAQWESRPNTQLETGGFIDLFMTSDAMIHDSGSFAVEYHYSRKPVMFVSRDLNSILDTQSEFGKLAYDMHYIGKTTDDIDSFVTHVVMEGNDSLKEKRDKFYNDYLLPPNGKTVAENTIEDLLKSLKLE
ncbi:MAG: CDP-glycerol glycerophosphotransferase family protein, partial [Bacteroidales bacterium]|nr:CDP-glycerol glycerophosphotransferase family protein [Candidatus Sodaliphilus fimicaballi]